MARCEWSESDTKLTVRLDQDCTATVEELTKLFSETEFRLIEKSDPRTIILGTAIDPTRIRETLYPGLGDHGKNLYSRFHLENGALIWLQHNKHVCVTELPEVSP